MPKVASVDNGRLLGVAAEAYIQDYIRAYGVYPPVEYVEVEYDENGEPTVVVELQEAPELTSAQKKARRLLDGNK